MQTLFWMWKMRVTESANTQECYKCKSGQTARRIFLLNMAMNCLLWQDEAIWLMYRTTKDRFFMWHVGASDCQMQWNETCVKVIVSVPTGQHILLQNALSCWPTQQLLYIALKRYWCFLYKLNSFLLDWLYLKAKGGVSATILGTGQVLKNFLGLGLRKTSDCCKVDTGDSFQRCEINDTTATITHIQSTQLVCLFCPSYKFLS